MRKINILAQIKSTVSSGFSSTISTMSNYSNTLNVVGRDNTIEAIRTVPDGIIRCGESRCGSKLHPISEACL